MTNLNQAAPNASLEFDGANRKLLFSFYALAQLKRLTGKNILKGQLDLKEPDEIVALVWATLLKAMPELDGNIVDGKPDENIKAALSKIGNWLTLDNFAHVSDSIMAAYQQAGGAVKEGAIDGEKK